MAKEDRPRIAILGAGPIGIEAALYAAHLGYPFQVFERERVGEHLHRWGHVRLFSPFGMNVTSLGLDSLPPGHGELPGERDCITGRVHLAAYLGPLSECKLLRGCIQQQTEVLHIGKKGLLKGESPGDSGRGHSPFLLLVRGQDGKERLEVADVVLDCTGTYGQARYLGGGGIPALGELQARAHIAYGLEDVLGERRKHYADRNVLVLGAGYSAATTVCALAELGEEHPSTWVIWLARGKASQPIRRLLNDPLRERDGLAERANRLATRGDRNVEFHAQSVVEAVHFLGEGKGFTVKAHCGGKPRTWDVDRVVANVGFTPDNGLYRELQIHECYASLGPMRLAASLLRQAGEDCLAIGPQGPEALRNPEPNFYILGAKSYGRNPHFLLRNGFEQVREVFSLLTQDPRLNLYATPQTKARKV